MESRELVPLKEEQIVNVGVLYNVFDPSQTIREELLYVEGQTLADYIVGLPDTCEWRVGLNAIPVKPEDYQEITVAPNDLITVVAIPRGGSGGKDILRMIAQVVVVVAAVVVGFAIGGPWGAAAAAAIAMTGTFLINVLLPPTMPGMAEDDGNSYGYDGAKNTAKEGVALPVVYGQFQLGGNYIDVFSENVGDDQFIYGRCVISDGEIDSVVGEPEINEIPISDYKDVQWGYTNGTLTQAANSRFNNAKAHFLRQDELDHVAWTEYTTTGDIDAFELNFVFPEGLANILIADGSKSNESVGVEIQYAPYGTSNYTSTGATGDVIQGYTLFTTTASPVATGFRVTMQGDEQSAIGSTASYTLQYRLAGAGSWTTYATYNDVSKTFYPKYTGGLNDDYWNEYRETIDYITVFPVRTVNLTLPSGSYEFQVIGTGSLLTKAYLKSSEVAGAGGAGGSTTVTYTDKRAKVIRKTYKSPTLTYGRYHIRVRRTTAWDSRPDHLNKINLTDVAEVIHSKVAVRSVATGWYVARMTDQLQGIPQVTWKVKGVKVDIYNVNGVVTATQWSDNPADIVLDMLISERRGPLRDKIDIDWPAFVEWRDYCTTAGLKFNGVFDQSYTLWDAMTQVFRVGRAFPVRIGTKLSVAVDKPTQPCMLFGPGNIYKDSFSISYLPMQERANEFEVSYFDKDDRNKKKTIRIADPDAAQAGQIPKTVSYELFGVDNFTQAQKDVWYQLYNNRLQRRVVSFDAPVEAIGLTIGDVAYVQHDMVEWGSSGRLGSGNTTTTVNLDKTVTLAPATTYLLLLIHSTLQKSTGNIALSTGLTYNLSALSTTVPTESQLKRIVTNTGDEAAILDFTYTGGSNATATLDRNVTGTTFTIYDVDVIEERTVTTGAGDVTSLTVSSAFSVAPAQYSNYMVGVNTIVKKPFRLRSITGEDIDRRTLTFGEYHEGVYAAPESDVPAPVAALPKTPNHISDLTLMGDPYRIGTTVNYTLSWLTADVYRYGGVDIYMSINGADYAFYNTVLNTNSMMIALQHGSKVAFKVVAFNEFGHRANINTAPVINIEAASVAATLTAPTSLIWTLTRVDFYAYGILSWTAPATAPFSPYTRIQIQYSQTGDWLDLGTTEQISKELTNVPAGTHNVRIRAENSTGAISAWVSLVVNIAVPTLTAPTIAGDGTAIDHDLNTDGSVNLSFEWSWAGNEQDIDGFQAIIHQDSASASYTLGTAVATESVSLLAPSKRIQWFYSLPADKYYTVYIRAYKNVHTSFAASGRIYSTAVKPALAGENPYRPEANVAWNGTIGGLTPDEIADSISNISNDDVITVNEKISALIKTATDLEARYEDVYSEATILALSTTALSTARAEWLSLLNSYEISPRASSDTFLNFTNQEYWQNANHHLNTTVDGPNQFTNGTFSTATLTEYTASTGNVSGAVVSNQLQVTNNGAGWYYRAFTTIIGRRYKFTGDFVTKNGGGRLNVGTSIGGTTFLTGSITGTHTIDFVATTTTTYVSMGDSASGSGIVNTYDNLNFIEIAQSGISLLTGYTSTRTGIQGAVDTDGSVDWFPADVPAINGLGYHTYTGVTNLLLQSQAFDNASWSKVSSASVTADTATAPDGTTTADTLTFIADANSRIQQNGTTVAASVYTWSVWLWTASGTKDLRMAYHDGTAWTRQDITVTTTPTRFVMAVTAATTTTTFTIYNDTAGTAGSVFGWQAQAVLGNFIDGGPHIATTTTTASLGTPTLISDIKSDGAALTSDFFVEGVVDFKSTGTDERFAYIVNSGATTNTLWMQRQTNGGLRIMGLGNAQVYPALSGLTVTTGKLAYIYRFEAATNTVTLSVRYGGVDYTSGPVSSAQTIVTGLNEFRPDHPVASKALLFKKTAVQESSITDAEMTARLLELASDDYNGTITNPAWNDLSGDTQIYYHLFEDQEFPTNWTNTSVTVTPNGPYQTLTDSSTTVSANLLRRINDINVGVNEYTTGIVVKKDNIGRALRQPRLMLELLGGTTQTIRLQIDTATGESSVVLGTATDSGSIDLGDEWLFWFSANTIQENTDVRVTFYPSTNANASFTGTTSTTATGSIDVRGTPLIVKGNVEDLGREVLNGRLKAYVATLTGQGLSIIPKNRGNWAASTTYRVGDIVQYANSTWICVTAHTSVSSEEPGDVANTNFEVLATQGNYLDRIWQRSNTQPSTPTGNNPTDWYNAPPTGTEALWESTGYKTFAGVLIGSWSTPVRTSGLVNRGAYNSATTYYENDTVIYGGGTYVAVQNNFSNQAPSGTAQANTYWDVLAAPGESAGSGSQSITLTLNGTVSGTSNLRTLADAQGYTGGDLTLTVNISGTYRGTSGGHGIRTGTFPTNKTISITITVQSGGIVDGGGGNGGQGGGTGGGYPGTAGGDAFYIEHNISGGLTINSGGTVRGGGKGGSGGAALNVGNQFEPQYAGGGGGGGGFPNGSGGPGGNGDVCNGSAGSVGTTSGGGSGGAGCNGAGGGITGSGAGVNGYAVRKNGKTCTVTNNGTMTGTAG
jgi:hypothetical protein